MIFSKRQKYNELQAHCDDLESQNRALLHKVAALESELATHKANNVATTNEEVAHSRFSILLASADSVNVAHEYIVENAEALSTEQAKVLENRSIFDQVAAILKNISGRLNTVEADASNTVNVLEQLKSAVRKIHHFVSLIKAALKKSKFPQRNLSAI